MSDLGPVWGYRRENGRVGIRNHVVILPLDDLSNSACEKVAYGVKGTKAIPHAYGRLQFGEDLQLFFRTMIGTGANPNVAAVVVIGIEPEWTNIIVDGIAETGKPVKGFSIERSGDFKTVEQGEKKASSLGDSFRQPPEAVAKRILHALESGKPRIRYPVTLPAHMGALFRRFLPASLIDRFFINHLRKKFT